MTDQDNLQNRLSKVVHTALCTWMNDPEAPGTVVEFAAQAITDDLELTAHGDDCGHHEIHGSYDTRFGEG